MPYTGPFPESNDTNMAAFRAAEIKRQGGGFKNAKAADTYVDKGRMTDDTAMDPFPTLKAGKHSPAGPTVHTPAGPDMKVPTKARPFGHEEGNTKPPKGRALPIRGEGATTNTGPTVGKNGIR